MDKNVSDTELIDYARDLLSASRRAEIEDALAGSEDLRGRLRFLTNATNELVQAVHTVADSRDTSFLTDQIMRRVARERVSRGVFSLTEFVIGIRAAFKPVITAALVLIIVLATYNVVSAGQSEAELNAAEAMLGLSPVTIADAYEASF